MWFYAMRVLFSAINSIILMDFFCVRAHVFVCVFEVVFFSASTTSSIFNFIYSFVYCYWQQKPHNHSQHLNVDQWRWRYFEKSFEFIYLFIFSSHKHIDHVIDLMSKQYTLWLIKCLNFFFLFSLNLSFTFVIISSFPFFHYVDLVSCCCRLFCNVNAPFHVARWHISNR